jgi:hypothetical protein
MKSSIPITEKTTRTEAQTKPVRIKAWCVVSKHVKPEPSHVPSQFKGRSKFVRIGRNRMETVNRVARRNT